MFKEMYEKMEEFKSLKVENINLPCKKCDGDCCGIDVHFTKEDIARISKSVSLKKYRIEPVLNGDVFIISTKGIKNTKCVFLKNNKCSIYKDRPEICQHYGTRVYIQCPYNNMDTIPADKETRTELTMAVQNIFYSKAEEILGKKLNLMPHTMKNALSKYEGK